MNPYEQRSLGADWSYGQSTLAQTLRQFQGNATYGTVTGSQDCQPSSSLSYTVPTSDSDSPMASPLPQSAVTECAPAEDIQSQLAAHRITNFATLVDVVGATTNVKGRVEMPGDLVLPPVPRLPDRATYQRHKPRMRRAVSACRIDETTLRDLTSSTPQNPFDCTGEVNGPTASLENILQQESEELGGEVNESLGGAFSTPTQDSRQDDDEMSKKEEDVSGDRKRQWRRGIVVRTEQLPEPLPNGDNLKLEIQTITGRVFINVMRKSTLSSMTSKRVKFTADGDSHIVKLASNSSCPMFSLNLRLGRQLSIRSTAILGYVEENPLSRKYILWCDDAGILYARSEDVAKWSNRLRADGSPLFEALRLVQINLSCEHSLSPTEPMFERSWLIKDITPLSEENLKGESAHPSSWPRALQRFDDLYYDDTRRQHTLMSPSFPTRIIICDPENCMISVEQLRECRANDLPLTGVMCPSPFEYIRSDGRERWQCLALGPIQNFDVISKGRLFNYRPIDILLQSRHQSFGGLPPSPRDVLYDTESY